MRQKTAAVILAAIMVGSSMSAAFGASFGENRVIMNNGENRPLETEDTEPEAPEFSDQSLPEFSDEDPLEEVEMQYRIEVRGEADLYILSEPGLLEDASEETLDKTACSLQDCNSFYENQSVAFYVIPYEGQILENVEAYSSGGETLEIRREDSVYEITMPGSDVLLDILTREEEIPGEPETDEHMEEESRTEGDAEIECTCMFQAQDPYQHDWSCNVFRTALMDDCTCGRPGPATEHSFSCHGLINAFASVCTCEAGSSRGVMHENCQVICNLHKELCHCKKDCFTIESALEHGEYSGIYQYLMKWAEYCNQSMAAWTNPDKPQTVIRSPKVSRVGRNYIEDKNYAFSVKYRKGQAPEGGFRDFNPSGVKKISVSGQGSNCYDPVDMKNKKASVSRRYYNVGIYNGSQIDVELFVSNPIRINTSYSSKELKPFIRFYDSRIGIGQGLVHDVQVEFRFYYNNTNTQVYPKGHITIKDLDGSARTLGAGFRAFENSGVDRISIYNQTYPIGNGGKLLNHLGFWYYTSSSSNKNYTLVKGRRYYDGTGGRVEIGDIQGWASIYFSGTFKIRVQLGDDVDAPKSETGANRHGGVYFDTPTTIGIYTPPDLPGKRCGTTTSWYENDKNGQNGMGWHNTTDASAHSALRPLDTKPGGTYKYGIAHTIYPMIYTSYMLTDQLDSCLTYVNNSAMVKNSMGDDVTGNFHISYSSASHRLTFTPKNLEFLDHKETFYFYFNVTLADGKTITDHGHHRNTSYYYIENAAEIQVNDQKAVTNKTYFRGNVPGEFYIKKFDSQNPSKVLKGAEFELYQWSQSENSYRLLAEKLEQNPQTLLYTTGVLSYTTENQGKFRIIEKKPPEGYEGQWSRDFSLLQMPSGTVFDAPNEKKLFHYGNIKITKRDSLTGEEITSRDGEFQVYAWSRTEKQYLDNLGEDGKVLWKEEDGAYVSEPLQITEDNEGRFQVVETKNPAGYEGDFEKEFVLVPSETAMKLEFEVKNDPIIPPLGEITVIKKIHKDDIIWAHGNPVFRFRVSGTDIKGIDHSYEDYIEFTEDHLKAENGYAVGKLTFRNIPLGTYKISEHDTLRYEFQSITADTKNVTVSGKTGVAVLDLDSRNAGVTFFNKIIRYDGFSHTDVIKNTIPLRW